MNRLQYTVVVKFIVDAGDAGSLQHALAELENIGAVSKVRARSVRAKKYDTPAPNPGWKNYSAAPPIRVPPTPE